jgi:deazaflavin-dependent oxidoreductase (nitroreductase family)
VKPPPSTSPFWKAFNVLARGQATIFRASKGRFGSTMQGSPVLLLHHVGRKSGTARVSPLIYLADGDRLLIVASKGGTDKNPAWFHNLLANPETEVELKGGERRQVRARRASDEERAVLWPRLVEGYGNYDDYQRQTDRTIPVVVLEPR